MTSTATWPRLTRIKSGIPALSSHDGVLFVSGGVHTVTVRKEQRFYTVASLLHILHHEDERSAGIAFVHRYHSPGRHSRYCRIRNFLQAISDSHGRAARKAHATTLSVPEIAARQPTPWAVHAEAAPASLFSPLWVTTAPQEEDHDYSYRLGGRRRLVDKIEAALPPSDCVNQSTFQAVHCTSGIEGGSFSVSFGRGVPQGAFRAASAPVQLPGGDYENASGRP